MKNWIFTLRKFLTIACANRIYRRCVRRADRLHARYRTRYYVVLNRRGNSLLVLDRAAFRKAMRQSGVIRRESMTRIREGAIYHTADAAEGGVLSPAEREARRLVWVRLFVRRAGV